MKKIGLLLMGFGLLLGMTLSAADKTTLDPTEITLGARSLGLGRSYVARLQDPHGLFLNPAQMATLTNTAISLTGTQMLGEIYRFYGSGSWIWNRHTNLGLGLVYTNEGGGNFRSYTNTVLGPDISYSDAMIIFGAAHRSGIPFFTPEIKNLFLGVNLKYYLKQFSGVTGGSSGFDGDFGAIYKPWNFFRLGFHSKNILSAAIKAIDNGLTEQSLPSYTVGFEWDLIGTGLLFDVPGNRVTLSADQIHQMYWNQVLSRLGLEWQIESDLFLRAGAYEEWEAISSTSYGKNMYLSFGLGYNFKNIQLNYAFQPNSELLGANHFVSVSFYEPKPKPEMQMVITNPQDKSIVYDAQTKVLGYLISDIGYVKINGKTIVIGKDLKIEYPFDLKLGKNKIKVEYFDEEGNLVDQKLFRILRMKQFEDIPETYFVRRTLEEIGTLKLITTEEQKLFEPEYLVLRKEMIAYLVQLYRWAEREIRNEPREDVQRVKTEDDFVNYLEDESVRKLVVGYPDKYLKPNLVTIRAEGASLFLRFHERYTHPVSVRSVKSFKDIDPKFWAAGSIAKAREAGIIHGENLNDFKPNGDLKKVDMALMMSRTKFVKDKIEDLYNWESY